MTLRIVKGAVRVGCQGQVEQLPVYNCPMCGGESYAEGTCGRCVRRQLLEMVDAKEVARAVVRNMERLNPEQPGPQSRREERRAEERKSCPDPSRNCLRWMAVVFLLECAAIWYGVLRLMEWNAKQ